MKKTLTPSLLLLMMVIILVVVKIPMDQNSSHIARFNPSSDRKIIEKSPESAQQFFYLDITRKQLITSIHKWIGKNVNTLYSVLEEPVRIDPSAYGYQWEIFKVDGSNYIQIGTRDSIITTVYVTGMGVKLDKLELNAPAHTIKDSYEVNSIIPLQYESFDGEIQLNEEDIGQRPLIQLDDNIWAQVYIDIHQQTISSIRIVDSETLLKITPYFMEYYGSIPESTVSEDEWDGIHQGAEQQILTITNIVRKRANVKELQWNEQVANVALKHSKHMKNNNYFAHNSPEGKTPFQRLNENGIYYRYAGENLYRSKGDAITAVEGWLNSYGHRQVLLKNRFEYLGVGVYEDHYTQMFIER